MLTQQESEVARLIDVELRGQQRPRAVIHPHARDVVAIGFEFAGRAADDGGIAAVEAHAREVAEEQFADIAGFGHQQRQNVLPQIAPAAPAASVVVIGQPRIARDAAQNRLQRHPLQPVIEARVARVEVQRR